MRVLGPTENFLALEKEYSKLETSTIAIVSAPYEETVSYGKGAGKGPSAILEASHFVEFWDEQFGRELCFEQGIATLEALDFRQATGRAMLDALESYIRALLAQDKFVVTLGGEHTISTAPVAAHFERFPHMSILQIDAHSDLRDSYGGSSYSHASVMSRIIEFFPPHHLVQVGIRAQCREEYELILQRGVRTFFAREIRQGVYGRSWKERVLDALDEEVYITFDLDALDPSIMAATGTPEPGGLYWDETLQLLELIGTHKRIVGFDVVELAPAPAHPFSSFLAAKLVYSMLNAAFLTQAPRFDR